MPHPVSISRNDNTIHFAMTFSPDGDMPATLHALGDEIDDFFELHSVPGGAMCHVHIAIEELVTNLAKFGSGGDDHVLFMECDVTVEADSLVIAVRDNGIGFDPAATPQPALARDPLDRSVGGLGIYMLFKMSSEHRYQRLGGCNHSVWKIPFDTKRE